MKQNDNETASNARGIAAIFQKDSGGRLWLFSVFVEAEETRRDGTKYISRLGYDVERSRKYGYVWHNSSVGGNGPIPVDGPYWTSGPIEVKEKPTSLVDPKDKPPWRGKGTRAIRKRNRTRRLRKLPKYFALQPGWDLYDWLVNREIEDEVVFCSICRDWFPGNPADLCEHAWWCDKTCAYSTPSERCGCATRDECRE